MASAADFTLSVAAVTAGQRASVTLSRPSAQYSAAFTVTFADETAAVEAEVVSQSDTFVVYEWEVPLAWCEAMADTVQAQALMTAQIAFDSAIDELDDPNVCTVTASFFVYVPESLVPEAALAVEVVNDNAVAALWGIPLRDLSRLRYTVTAQPPLGAAVSGCEFCWGGQTAAGFSGTTPLLSAAGTVVPTARVTDSRGRTVSVEGEALTVWDYHLPRLSAITVMRCDAEGVNDSGGDHLKLSAAADCAPVGGRNSVTLSVRIRPVGGTWGSAVTLESGTAAVLAADAAAVYEAQFTAVDTLGNERTVTAMSGTAAVAFHLREGGCGAAFGKRAETDGFHCGWDADFDGDVSVGGTLAAASLTVADKSLLDWVYPVGAVYASLVQTSPAVLFGGTWEAIEGKFLLGCGTGHDAGTAGGSESHCLTNAELPAHTHRVLGYTDAENVGHEHTIPNIRTGQSGEYGVYAETWGYGSGSRDLNTDFTDITHNHRVDITSQSTGSGTAFSLLPPYLAVYMWQRTA